MRIGRRQSPSELLGRSARFPDPQHRSAQRKAYFRRRLLEAWKSRQRLLAPVAEQAPHQFRGLDDGRWGLAGGELVGREGGAA